MKIIRKLLAIFSIIMPIWAWHLEGFLIFVVLYLEIVMMNNGLIGNKIAAVPGVLIAGFAIYSLLTTGFTAIMWGPLIVSVVYVLLYFASTPLEQKAS